MTEFIFARKDSNFSHCAGKIISKLRKFRIISRPKCKLLMKLLRNSCVTSNKPCQQNSPTFNKIRITIWSQCKRKHQSLNSKEKQEENASTRFQKKSSSCKIIRICYYSLLRTSWHITYALYSQYPDKVTKSIL